MVIELLEESIRNHALANAALVALIEQRWYGSTLPIGTKFPAVTIQEISNVPVESLAGHGGIDVRRYQITVHADCGLNCLRVAHAIRAAFPDGFRGTLAGNGSRVQRIARVNSIDLGKDPGQNIHRYLMDYKIWETIPQ